MSYIAEAPLMLVVYADRVEIAPPAEKLGDAPRLYVRRGGLAQFCADSTLWRHLSEGKPVAISFEDANEAHAVIEALQESRQRKPHVD
jgi:hypothetical protein